MNYVRTLEGVEIIVDIIKIFIIISFTYCIELKILNKKVTFKKNIFFIVLFVILAIGSKILKDLYGFAFYIMFFILVLSVILSKTLKNSMGQSIISTTIALSISYIMFFVSLIISFIPSALLSIQNDYYNLLIIIIIYSIFLYVFGRSKRLSKGISFLQIKFRNEYVDIMVLNTSVVILFGIILSSNYRQIITSNLGISIIIFSIIMFITIQKSLQLYYKQKLQEREVSDIKEEIKSKDREIKELEKENLKLNKINHSLSHKIKSIEYELNQTAIKTDMQKEKDLKNKVEKLSKEMQSDIVPVELSKTDIAEIDSMLEYMQSECIKNKIDFQLQVSGNIHHMVNTYIQKENMEILIADLIKNAIIAINHTENINKSILVRLGIIEGFYSLYIYDSGIEFEIDTLINIGNKPSTTHKNDGGTGMGFMNTFDTLRKYKASIVICEYGKPSEERFTKLIKIIFDKKNEYKISSYRDEKIREKDFEKRIKISKESTY